MTAIASPQPRRASRKPSAILPLSSPFYVSTDLPPRNASSGITSPPRLLSPIHLGDPMNYLSKAPTTCSPRRRRGVAGASGRAARRRHVTRPDCAVNFATGPAMFDRLSWISQLQDAPECVDIWDIADLSLLPIEQQSPNHTSGVGPVRSRKSSLRTDPIASAPASDHQDRPSRRNQSIPLLPLLDRDILDPRTPPPRDRSEFGGVQFHELLPALSVYECRP
ncbi:hypothetical protein EIP91_009459 [Steccherinum ochraceum]|uniref:Uncharacterized protein n=1 Tax=Steccherinum ochraceum TaxID=92696 RepID=A0A4R0RTI9_9APHY|nr:hypothetical protein EIP91_009459 [Steccherinum ochraceum]